MFKAIKRVLGLQTITEKVEQYNELVKAEQENLANRELLASEYTNHTTIYKNIDKFTDSDRKALEERYESFMKGYFEDLGKLKREFDKLKVDREKLYSSDEVRKAIELSKITKAIDIINKSDIDGLQKEELIGKVISKAQSGIYAATTANKKKGIVGIGYGEKNMIVESETANMQKEKVRKVMSEFKAGTLKSSSGEKVTNRKQALAIAMSEAGISKAEKEETERYNKGCLMIDTNIPNWKEVIDRVADEDVDETEGKEPEQHVTVLYGFDMDKVTPEQVKEALEGFEGDVSLKIKNVSLFDNPKYDVLKFDVESEDLVKLNKMVKKLPNEDDYPDYHPHMTIAYLKKGKGKDYLDKFDDIIGKEVKSNKFTYSYSPKEGGKLKDKFTKGETIDPLDIIEKAFKQGLVSEDILEKARTGTYSDNAQNRRLKRVGQKYGSSKQTENEPNKQGKQEEGSDTPKAEVDLTEQAKNASVAGLENAIKESKSPEVREAAHAELDRREKEEKPQADGGEKEVFGEEKSKDNEKPEPEKEQPPNPEEKKDEKEAKASMKDEEKKGDQTKTKEFKEWFGDSKVVDEKGDPLVVYHGTTSDFKEFNLDETGKGTDTGMFGKGFYFSEDKKYSETYAKREGKEGEVKEVYLSIKNPYEIKSKKDIPDIKTPDETMEDLLNSAENYSKAFRELLQKKGYDGVIAYDFNNPNNKNREIVAFEPNQIKSATSNKGTFDPNSNDITKAEQIKGGIGDNKTISDIANKHKVDIKQIKGQISKGVKVEMEHTDDYKKAMEITMDHLMESPTYYDKLEEMETTFEDKEGK